MRLTLAAVFSVGASSASPIPLIEARPAGILEPEHSFSVTLPSDVVRLPGSRWAILDGINDRVVITDDAGGGLSAWGADELDSPLGLTRGPDGNLWIADSGNRRVASFDDAGALFSSHVIPTEDLDRAPDPVDLAIDIDGETLLVVDNDNHTVHSLRPETGEWLKPWGSLGSALDQFNHPYSIAVGPGGERAVVDVINSRVQSHDPEFDFTFQVGDWGVDAGDLYRPKGVAIDGAHRIWISDSVLGVVQVFSETGVFIGVLGDGDGVRHFTTPTRLAFDERGRLAVVEMAANRVSLWEVGE